MCKYIDNHNIKKFYAPIPHPALINFPVECEEFGETRLKNIMQFLAFKDIYQMEILDCSHSQGYYARNMHRIGFKKCRYIDEKEENIQLTKLINRLLGICVLVDQINLFEIDTSISYDIVFLLKEYQADLYKKNVKILELLDTITRKYLVLEFNNSMVKEVVLENTNFSSYKFLFKEYRDGSVWETGIVIKE